MSSSKTRIVNTTRTSHDFTEGMTELERLIGENNLSVEFLAGDGSDRTYHRVLNKEKKSVGVIMKVSDLDNSKILKGSYDWCLVNETLQSNGLIVPKIFGSIQKINALVIEDFGNEMLENIVAKGDDKETLIFYKKACDTIVDMLSIKPTPSGDVWTSRAFDKEKLSFELNFFKKHYLENSLKLELTDKERAQLNLDIDSICEYLSEFSNYFTHRDYHSRNILIHEGEIGLIDFQDARLGPPSYDIVSLIFDPYINASFEDRMSIYSYFEKKLVNESVKADLKETFKAMALQRILKAIGSFGYLTLEVKRGDYLKYVPKAVELLRQLDVKDERWPFLTDKLINRLV